MTPLALPPGLQQEILYAGNSSDIPVLAVLMYSRGVPVPRDYMAPRSATPPLTLDDRKQIIKDRIANALPRE